MTVALARLGQLSRQHEACAAGLWATQLCLTLTLVFSSSTGDRASLSDAKALHVKTYIYADEDLFSLMVSKWVCTVCQGVTVISACLRCTNASPGF